ncbi:MAG: hypothetical protein ACK2US_03645 [Anaerolineae bacterium]|jgi:hypothetical protein
MTRQILTVLVLTGIAIVLMATDLLRAELAARWLPFPRKNSMRSSHSLPMPGILAGLSVR